MRMARARRTSRPARAQQAESYQHLELGTQAQFKKPNPPSTHRYDPSLSGPAASRPRSETQVQL